MEPTKIPLSRYYFVNSIPRLAGKWLTLLITNGYFNLPFTRSYGATFLIQHVLKMAAQIKVPLRNKVIINKDANSRGKVTFFRSLFFSRVYNH